MYLISSVLSPDLSAYPYIVRLFWTVFVYNFRYSCEMFSRSLPSWGVSVMLLRTNVFFIFTELKKRYLLTIINLSTVWTQYLNIGNEAIKYWLKEFWVVSNESTANKNKIILSSDYFRSCPKDVPKIACQTSGVGLINKNR